LCFSAADGKKLWKHEYDCTYTVSIPAGRARRRRCMTASFTTLGTEGHLFASRRHRKVVWAKTSARIRANPPLWGHSAHPLIDGNKLICVVGGEGSVAVAFDKNTGKELWRCVVGP